MADKEQLSIVIEAINNASKQLKEVTKDLGLLSKETEGGVKPAEKSAMSFGKLVAGMATGTIVANIVTGAFKKLTSVLSDLPGMFYDLALGASEIEGMGIAMHVVANNAGIAAAAVDEVRDSVIAQNVTTQAANKLMTDLIRNQVDYTQATELAAAAQNIAVASGVSSSETIERISQSISSGRTWLLRQLGLVEHLDSVYKRYAETLGRTSEELTESERKQAVVNYILEEGEKYAGAYGAAMLNASKKIRSTGDRIKEVSYSLGKVFGPALYEITNEVYNFVNSIVKWAHENDEKLKVIAKSVGDFVKGVVGAIRTFIKNIPWGFLIDVFNLVIRRVVGFGAVLRMVYNVIQIFVRGIQNNISSIKALGQALSALMKGDFKALKDVYINWQDSSKKTNEAIKGDIQDIGNAYKTGYQAQKFDLKEWWDSVEAIEGSGWEDKLKEAEEGFDELTQKQKDALKKMTKQIEKENKNYIRAVEKRVKDYKESLDEMVMDHRDAINEIEADLKDESRNYDENLVDMLSDYNEAMDDMETSHKKKTDSILEDMEDERKKSEEEIEKITEKYDEQRVLLEREGEARLGDLKAQLAKERALGDNANDEKVAALEQMIAYEENGLSTSLDEKKAKYDEEVADINEKLNDKLDKIKKELDEENTLYTESFNKRKEQYDEDVFEAKESYIEKRDELQKSLDEETVIREKYADDFERIGDRMREDDITKMIQKHGETMEEMKRDHEERLMEIKESGLEQGLGFTENLAAGIESGYPQVKNQLDKINNDINQTVSKANELSFTGQGVGVGTNYPEWWGGGGGGGGGGAFQKGGLATRPGIVGESGPEVVLPLDFPKRMAMIMKSMGIGGNSGGQVTQNFYVTVQDNQDVDVLMERAGYAMKQGGGY